MSHLPLHSRLRVLLLCVIAACGLMPVRAQDATPSPATPPVPRVLPAHRKATNVAIITIRGEVDGDGRMTPSAMAMSVQRRIAIAEREGADALVLEIDSEVGSYDACSRIAEMVRETTISRTFAWLRPSARGNSAVIALACREIIADEGATLGGITLEDRTRGRTRAPRTLAHREDRVLKLVQSLIDDAREHNDAMGEYVRDEYVQLGLGVGDLPLWWAARQSDGAAMALDMGDAMTLFAGQKLDLPPLSGVSTVVTGQAWLPPVGAALGYAKPHADLPAGSRSLDAIAQAYANEPSQTATRRVSIPRGERGAWTLAGRAFDGTGPPVLDVDALSTLGLIANRERTADGTRWLAAPVRSDEELGAFLGSQRVVRLHPTISDSVLRVLSHPGTKMALIVIFIIAMLLEMLKPGTLIGATVSTLALLLLIAPSMILGLAGAWEVIAILAGVALIALEVFVLPGVGIPGFLGGLLLLGGLVSLFVPQGAGMFDGPGGLMQSRGMTAALYGLLLVLGAIATSALVGWVLIRQIGSLPVFNKLVLTSGEEVAGATSGTAIIAADAFVRVGNRGVTLTRMQPAGRVEIEGEIIDAVSDSGLLDKGVRVRVAWVDGIRVGVERLPSGIIEEPASDTT